MKRIDLIFFASFTVLLAYDFFPELSSVVAIPNAIFILILLTLIIVSIIVGKAKGRTNKASLKWQLVTTLYIIFLVGLFTILGGESAVGISFTNRVFWVVFAVWLIDIIFRWRRENKIHVIR